MIAHQSVADILRDHVRLAVEGIDRMYLNVYVPQLQSEQGVVRFFKYHRGQPLPSAALMSPLSRDFVAQLERFVTEHGIALVQFRKGERKDAVMAEHLTRFAGEEGVLFVGKAQEKTPVFRTEKRRSPTTGRPYPWIVRSSAMVNHYYVYAVDHDFGPFFLKFCSYFPFNARLCLNGHEYAKRQLAKQGIAFEALDNGILSCADPARLQRICDGLSAAKIDALLRKWLRLLPHPFSAADRRAGYRYDISILQAEFSLTQVLDRPQHGRQLFEQVIRENLDLGRPEQVQLIFNAACACTASSSECRRASATASQTSACASPCSSPAPTTAYCVPVSPPPCPARALSNPLKRAFDQLDTQLTASIAHLRLAAKT